MIKTKAEDEKLLLIKLIKIHLQPFSLQKLFF